MSAPIVASERTVTAGYAEWAATYDISRNPMFLAEEPIVHGLLARYSIGAALDAACGTGRHAAYLASLGHQVTGIDSTPEMLEMAKAKVPAAQFETGDLTAIPLSDGAMDTAVSPTGADPLRRSGAAHHESSRAVVATRRACSLLRRPPLDGAAWCSRRLSAKPVGARVHQELRPFGIGLSHGVSRLGTQGRPMHRASLGKPRNRYNWHSPSRCPI